MPKYYFYKLTHDNGGAPCIQDDVLSLAICKPMIRRTADEHDIIIGFAANSLHPDNRLIYIARVWKRLEDGEYFKRTQYRVRPDCIYFWRGAKYHVKNSAQYHGSLADLYHDLGVSPGYRKANALLSRDFCYFGAAGSSIYKQKFPTVAKAIADLKQGHRVYHSPQLLQELAQLAAATCSLKGPHVHGQSSEKPARYVCLRGGSCGVAC
jgi:hypothetical protein